MPVDDLWYTKKKDADGNWIPSQRHGRGKRWRARWPDPDQPGKEPTKLFTKKSDAERYVNNMLADISRGLYVDPAGGKITVREYAEKWRATQIHADTTETLVETAFRLHISPLLGDMPLASVRRGHIQSWVKDRSTPGVLAPSTVQVVYGYVAAMFKAAVLDRVIGVSPCVGIKLPDVADGDKYIPTPAEIHAVAAELPPYYRAAVYVAAGCGLRPQEVFGLELQHVDWLRRELAVRQQVKYAKGERLFVGKLKTRTSRRDVDLPAQALEELARLMEMKPPAVQRMWDRVDPRNPVERDVQLLFTTQYGRPVNRSGWSTVWRRALKRADEKARLEAYARGEQDAKGVTQGWTMHALRHFFATSLIHRGASVKTVQLALGHSKPSITLDTYTHEWPDVTERTRTLMDDALTMSDQVSGSSGTGS